MKVHFLVQEISTNLPQHFKCVRSFHIRYIYLCADVREHISALAKYFVIKLSVAVYCKLNLVLLPRI